MSRPQRHPKTGVFILRKRVPADLVATLCRREITRSLHTRDPEEAKRLHAAALSELESEWELMRLNRSRVQTEGSYDDDEDPDLPAISEREAFSLAEPLGQQWVDMHFDEPSSQTWWSHLYDRLWDVGADLPEDQDPDHGYLRDYMRRQCRGMAIRLLSKHQFSQVYGLEKTARVIGTIIQKASFEVAKMARGDFERTQKSWGLEGSQSYPRPREPKAGNKGQPIALLPLVDAWWRESQMLGLTESTFESYRNTFKNLKSFLGHDSAIDVTVQDVIAFKDHRLSTLSSRTGKPVSAKTVKDSDLAALKAVFGWAVSNRLIPENPAATVKLKLVKPEKLRPKGFLDDEAKAILRAARYRSRGHEHVKLFEAKRWISWLCAFTGARVGEIGQLRKSDVFQRNEHWIIRITPEAGTVKAKETREVPLHQQVIDVGFIDFLRTSGDGHLFLNVEAQRAPRGALRTLKNRLREFSREIVPDPNVAPNHGWRHRFKTIGMQMDISTRVLDAIQGHAPRTAAERYGEVTLETMATALSKFPRYDVGEPEAEMPTGGDTE